MNRDISFIGQFSMTKDKMFSSLHSENNFLNFKVRNHGGSLNKMHCVTLEYYISVTMRKIILFTSRLLCFLIFGMRGLF